MRGPGHDNHALCVTCKKIADAARKLEGRQFVPLLKTKEETRVTKHTEQCEKELGGNSI